MAKSLPFYDSDRLTLYEDRMIIKDGSKRTVKYSDIYYIVFKRLGFLPFDANNPSIALSMKNGEFIKIKTTLDGYYAFKTYYNDDKKINGRIDTVVPTIIFIIAVFVLLGSVLAFIY